MIWYVKEERIGTDCVTIHRVQNDTFGNDSLRIHSGRSQKNSIALIKGLIM